MNAALIIIFGVLLLSIFLGIRAQKGKDMNLEQWTVGGRGFGTVFVFLLMAGEIYTTFTFLGGSGWYTEKAVSLLYHRLRMSGLHPFLLASSSSLDVRETA